MDQLLSFCFRFFHGFKLPLFFSLSSSVHPGVAGKLGKSASRKPSQKKFQNLVLFMGVAMIYYANKEPKQ